MFFFSIEFFFFPLGIGIGTVHWWIFMGPFDLKNEQQQHLHS